MKSILFVILLLYISSCQCFPNNAINPINAIIFGSENDKNVPSTESEKEVELQAETKAEEYYDNVVEGDIAIDDKMIVGKSDTSTGSKRDVAVFSWKTTIIPYVFDQKISNTAKEAFTDAIKDFQNFTCITFRPRVEEKDFFNFTSQFAGCWSYIGQIGGGQVVNLGPYCEYKGTAIHEIMHGLGFFHEQSRLDRDEYIKVNFDNIRKGRENNFKKYAKGRAEYHGASYDFDSVLHYGPHSFAKEFGLLTIEPRNSSIDISRIGQRQGFSKTDIEQVNTAFQCNPTIYSTIAPSTASPFFSTVGTTAITTTATNPTTTRVSTTTTTTNTISSRTIPTTTIKTKTTNGKTTTTTKTTATTTTTTLKTTTLPIVNTFSKTPSIQPLTASTTVNTPLPVSATPTTTTTVPVICQNTHCNPCCTPVNQCNCSNAPQPQDNYPNTNNEPICNQPNNPGFPRKCRCKEKQNYPSWPESFSFNKCNCHRSGQRKCRCKCIKIKLPNKKTKHLCFRKTHLSPRLQHSTKGQVKGKRCTKIFRKSANRHYICYSCCFPYQLKWFNNLPQNTSNHCLAFTDEKTAIGHLCKINN